MSDMKFKNVNLLKVGVRDVKDRIFKQLSFKDSVSVLENDSPLHTQDFGVADNFQIKEGVVSCDVTIFDKYADKLKVFKDEDFSLHPFLLLGKSEKNKEGYHLIDNAGITGLFFNRMKLYADFKTINEYKVEE